MPPPTGPLARPTLTVLDEYGVEDGTSVRAQLGIGTVSTTRKLKVAWQESGDVARHFLGYAALQDDRLRRLLPAPHPKDPSLIAVQVCLCNGHRFLSPEGADPLTPGGEDNRLADQTIGAVYDGAIVEVQYERAKFAMREDDDVDPDTEEHLRYCETLPPQLGMDVIALPGNGYSFVVPSGGTVPPAWVANGNTLPIPYGLPLPDPYRDIKVRWARVPAALVNEDDPSPWLQRLYGLTGSSPPLLNSVNQTLFKGWKPGTAWLIDVAWELRPAPFPNVTTTFGGDLTYASQYDCQEADITFTFRVRNSGVPWNWFYYNDPTPPGSGSFTSRSGWYPISRSKTYHPTGTVPDGDAPKPEKEFRELFRVSA